MNVKEFAAAAGVTVQTVRLWIKTGKITAKKIQQTPFRQAWEIPPDELARITHKAHN
jgi:predicted site-specific integrase-resolvase